MPELENLSGVRLHHERIDDARYEEGPWQPVADLVTDHRAAVVFVERVRVNPFRVRSSQLCVAEAGGRFPFGDLRPPLDRHAVQPQLVVDQRTRAHDDGRGVEDAEAEEGRRDALKIKGIAIESERLAARSLDHLRSFEYVIFHNFQLPFAPDLFIAEQVRKGWPKRRVDELVS